MTKARAGRLTRRILIPVVALLVAAGAISAAVSFYLAKSEADELLDYQLMQLARVVEAEGLAAQYLPPNARDADPEDDFAVYIWDEQGRLSHRTPVAPVIARPAAGFSSVSVDGARWRVFSERSGGHQIAVSQRLELRTELAGAGALQALIPVLALVPLLGLLIGWIVLRSLAPLRALSREVERRAATDLKPLPESDVPEELRPLLHAFNGLLARLDETLVQQKRFVTDAAHELRTPLAALQLQAEKLEGPTEEIERTARARSLRSGITRLTGLVSQLLTLARLDAAPPAAPVELDLLEAVKQVIADLYPLAEARGINLGLTGSDSVRLRGHPAALRALVANLIDNALRYTPEGGQVDVAVRRGERKAVLSVTDTGPGIPDDKLERVFDRFYRVESGAAAGHGLGLAIARTAAEQHRARITLENRRDGPGLRASVIIAL